MTISARVRELRERRSSLYTQASAIIVRAADERRDLTADERASVDRFHDEVARVDVELRDAGDAPQPTRAGGRQSAGDPNPGGSDDFDFDNAVEARALRDGETVSDFVRARRPDQAETFGNLRAGQYLRAMVTGPRTDVERRALSEGSDSAGGHTVPSILSAQLIDALRALLVTSRAGARMVPLETDKTSFAKLLTDPVATWRSEGSPVSEDSPTFGRVLFQPQTLAVVVKASRELVEDSLNIESALEMAFASSTAVEVDRVALVGVGTSEPRGISETDDIGDVEHDAALEDYDPLLSARGLVLAANAREPSAYIMAPRTSTEIAKLKTGLTGDKTQLPRPAELRDVPFLPTSSIPIDDTTSADASRIITGDFRDLWIGMRTQLRVEVLRELFAENLQFGFLAYLRADIGVTRPASFAQVSGIVPPE